MEATPGTAIPIRIWSPLLPEFQLYLDKNTTKYLIGMEEKGKNETPHHHIWAVTEKSPDSFRKHLKKLCQDKGLPVTQKGKANAYYSISTPDENYDESYSVKNGCHLSKTYTLEEINGFVQKGKKRFPNKIEGGQILDLPVLAQNIAQASTIRPVKRMPMKDKFMNYMLNEKQWKPGQEIHCESEDYIPKCKKLARHLTDCFENGFTVPEGQRMYRHAMYKFSDEATREYLYEKNEELFFKSCGI